MKFVFRGPSKKKPRNSMRSRRGQNQRRNSARRNDSFDRLEDRQLLAGDGLLAQYYNDANLSTPVALVRVDANADFDWGSGSPDSSISADTFSVRWSGELEARYSEAHDFIVNANDGARLWVNGQLMFDEFQAGSLTDETATIDLIAGRRYDIQLEYVEHSGDASISLEWNSVSQSREIIPTEQLFSSARGSLLNEKYDNITGSNVSDLTSSPNFPDNPSFVSTFPSFQSFSNVDDNFGRRMRGYLHAPATGSYTFYIAADQTAELWLSNTEEADQKQLIATVDAPTQSEDWFASATQQSVSIELVAGQKYYVEALLKDSTGDDHLAVGWLKPGSSAVNVVPGEHLSPVTPTVRIYSIAPSVAEGSPVNGVYRIVRSGGPIQQPLTVNYQVSGEATNGVDFQTLDGSITIPANANSVDLEVQPVADNSTEGDESVVIELLADPSYVVGYQSERTAVGAIQDDIDAPAGGTGLWSGTDLADFSRFGGTFTTESDPTYGNVIQAVLPSGQSNPWNAQLKQDISTAVTVGDILFLEFKARAIGAPGQFSAIFERAGTPFTKSLSQGINVSTDWSRIQIPFIAAESYAAGEASAGFHLAFGSQTLQFTDFELLNYGAPKSLAPETAFNLNSNGGTYGFAQNIPVSGQPFSFAYEVETTTVPNQNWHIQAVERNESTVANGDTMRLEFYVRATSGTNPRTTLAVQRTDTYATLHNQLINLDSNWQFLSIDVVSDDDYAAEGLQVVFNVGHELQTIQLGGFHWTNQDNNFDLEELPSQFPTVSYGGRDGTDPWRDDADTRIENNRQSQVTVSVVDASNQPVDGAVVSIRQTEHDFLFGSAINASGGKLDPNGNAQALKYQSEINRLFNGVVLENSVKWPGFLSDRQRGLDGAAFATNNDLELRGHNVIWPSRQFMPSSIWAEYDQRVIDDGAAAAADWLKTTIEDRFDDVLNTFDGVIAEWDVVNEPWSNHDVMDILGDSIVVDWYQRMRDFDPNIALALNDYGIFARNGSDTNHRSNFEYWLGLLNDEGLLDVIGEQSHYNEASLTDITVLEQLVNTYNTQFNKPIAITEFDVDSSDEQLQADYLRDYLTMSFSLPAINQFLHWGFWQDSHWIPDAALYRNDFSIKPNGQAYEDLVFGRWWTDIQGTTRNGDVSTDAFLGEYEVVVQYAGETYSGVVTVDDTGASSLTVVVATSGTTTYSLGNLGSGIAVHDDAVGSGFIMFSSESVHSRFATSPPNANNSDHLIGVRWANNQWEYSDNFGWHAFTPVAEDRLIAIADYSADTLVDLEGASGQINGVQQGYETSDMTFAANIWNGTPNAGEFTITGTFFEAVESTTQTFQIGDTGFGIAVDDIATGSGYILFSAESVHTRFAAQPPNSNNSDHLIAVRFENGQWEYNDNLGWYSFAPTIDDRLLAEVDFSADTITSLIGVGGQIAGIEQGYSSGDLTFASNVWNGSSNFGEFSVMGTYFDVDVNSNVFALGELGYGIAVHDHAVGNGFIMYSAESVHTRFAATPPNENNSDHLIGVRYQNNEWEYSDNSTWVVFTPDSDDRLLASVDFSSDTLNSLQGSSGQVGGINQGFESGDLVFFVNQWNGAANAGEFVVTGTSFEISSDSTYSLGPIGSGVAVHDAASGAGYMMFSTQNIHSRFASSPPNLNNSDHLIGVRFSNSQWYYSDNLSWIAFVPNADDRLLAAVDYSADTITSLIGMNGQIEGIDQGYQTGDLAFFANQWNGSSNLGEFTVTGTFFT